MVRSSDRIACDPVPDAPISVVVRVRDEAPAIERCLELLAGQRVSAPVEVIVVDDESRDGTAELARRAGAQVVSIDHARFSFGRALNLGAERAQGELVVALSAHAFPRDEGWLARLVDAFEQPDVACACGERLWPDGRPLAGAVRYDASLAQRYPEWGYSNAAGAFRRALWSERRFREDLPGCEDKEWGRHWVLQGRVCLLDPALAVEHDHTHDPVTAIYRRARREAAGFAMFLDRAPMTLGEVTAEWWGDTRFYGSKWRARLSHRRLARIAGSYAGARSARPTRP